MNRITLIIKISIMILITQGCSNPGIVKVSDNTYMLSRMDRAGIFGNASANKASVIEDANKFARSMGKSAIPINSREIPMRPGQLASFEYQFKLVEPNSTESKNKYFSPAPDVVIEKKTDSKLEIESSQSIRRERSFYDKLIQLEDLRSKGILTDDEFKSEKMKLLNQNQ